MPQACLPPGWAEPWQGSPPSCRPATMASLGRAKRPFRIPQCLAGGGAGEASGLVPSHLEARRGSPTQARLWWELAWYCWQPFLPQEIPGGGKLLETRGQAQ